MAENANEEAVAVLAAGCFWGVEATLQDAAGVLRTRVGYCGGHLANPSYQAVCRGDSGHAEAVEVVFDAAQTSYADVLEVFWRLHDPTQHNRQGVDIGSQYRSAIFYVDDTQKQSAEASKFAAQKNWRAPIVTEIVPLGEFWQAEDYHQNYVQKRRRHGFF